MLVNPKQVMPFDGKFGLIRAVDKLSDNEDLWFVGKDIAAALGYKNPSNAIHKHVSEDNKRLVSVDIWNGTGTATTRTMLISEAGVYELILNSNIPAAVEFQEWVCREVLPSIRKFGQYPPPDLTNPDNLVDFIVMMGKRMQQQQFNHNTEVLL